ncbi:ASCH domain-containing protein [Natribacillus halophilus]|nr:ASCH domain-containing protein [Natribacillus halophilus]
MNQAARLYWDEYWQENEQPSTVSAWAFGAQADELAQLVIDGVKTATCSAYILYEIENEPLPTTDDYSIILNSADEPVAIIKTEEVTLTPMNEVTAEFARAEGEGDRSYQYWKDEHEKFFKTALKEFGYEFSEDLLLVCERFSLVDVKRQNKL